LQFVVQVVWSVTLGPVSVPVSVTAMSVSSPVVTLRTV
jgi:hypothetical protein